MCYYNGFSSLWLESTERIFIAQVLLKGLEASNTRLMHLPLNFGFSNENIKNSTVFSHSKTVVCMFDSWSHWRNETGRFSVSNIDPTLCSQLVYRNVGINKTTFQIKIFDQYLAENMGWFRQTVAFSKQHPHLKVLLSVGGWTEGSSTFSKIAADYEKRSIFVNSVLQTLQKYGFHGLDMAWEYPAWAQRGGHSEDKKNFPVLMKELKDALGNDYMISLTAAGDTNLAFPAYNVKALSKLVDQINVRSFDFSGAWTNRAYHHSALNDVETHQSVASSVKFFLENGVPSDKLVVGIPFYGRTFLLKDDMSSMDGNASLSKSSGLGEATEGSFKGPWIGDKLLLGYHEICNEINQNDNWQTYWDNFCNVPYSRDNHRWITFDNPESVEAKIAFAMKNKLRGVMAWTIDTDDFSGTACGTDKDNEDKIDNKITYPLLRTINFAVASEEENENKRSIHGPAHSSQNEENKTPNPNIERSGFESNAAVKISLSITALTAVILSFKI